MLVLAKALAVAEAGAGISKAKPHEEDAGAGRSLACVGVIFHPPSGVKPWYSTDVVAEGSTLTGPATASLVGFSVDNPGNASQRQPPHWDSPS